MYWQPVQLLLDVLAIITFVLEVLAASTAEWTVIHSLKLNNHEDLWQKRFFQQSNVRTHLHIASFFKGMQSEEDGPG